MLLQSTHSSVASSTPSSLFVGPAAANQLGFDCPMWVSARALSNASATEPTLRGGASDG